MSAAPSTESQVIALDSLTRDGETVKDGSALSTGLSAKGSFLEVTPPASSRRKIFIKPSRGQMEEAFYAVLPLLLYAAAIGLAVVQLIQTTLPLQDLRQVGGTARMEYFVMSSCAIAPGTTERICTPCSLNANFVPSLLLISPAVPGFALQQLHYYSSQTPAIYFSSLCCIFVSFLLFLPVWILAYFPTTIIFSKSITKVIRRFAWSIYVSTGVLAFASMILSLTVGISWKLILEFEGIYFLEFIQKAYFTGVGPVTSESSFWKIVGAQEGFRFTWAQTTFAGMIAIGAKAALHNLMDERVERWGQDDDFVNFRY